MSNYFKQNSRFGVLSEEINGNKLFAHTKKMPQQINPVSKVWNTIKSLKKNK